MALARRYMAAVATPPSRARHQWTSPTSLSQWTQSQPWPISTMTTQAAVAGALPRCCTCLQQGMPHHHVHLQRLQLSSFAALLISHVPAAFVNTLQSHTLCTTSDLLSVPSPCRVSAGSLSLNLQQTSNTAVPQVLRDPLPDGSGDSQLDVQRRCHPLARVGSLHRAWAQLRHS